MERAALMAASLSAAARGAGLCEAETEALGRVFSLAMQPRLSALSDDHHPAYLHPGRSALVLVHDVGSVGAVALSAAMLHESTDERFRVSSDEVTAAVGSSTAEAIEAIPLPGDERLMERLLSLPPEIALAALAERLDHLRHLHLRPDLTDSWAEAYDEVVRDWLPFSDRTHPTLARRYAHWTRTFVKRLER